MQNLTVPTSQPPALTAVESGLKFLPKSVARDLASLPDRAEVVAECQAVIAAERPARPDQFAIVLEKLALHYPENRLSPGEQKLVLQDWRRLMGHLPADILQAAADAYVMSPARFFPTPGQLHAQADKLWGVRKILAQRARDTLELIQQQVAH